MLQGVGQWLVTFQDNLLVPSSMINPFQMLMAFGSFTESTLQATWVRTLIDRGQLM
jgi:hypothetical protein